MNDWLDEIEAQWRRRPALSDEDTSKLIATCRELKVELDKRNAEIAELRRENDLLRSGAGSVDCFSGNVV